MPRDLWRPPQLRIGEGDETERHATWLELFYDLVFVVAVAELAHSLDDHLSPSGLLAFIVLFIPVWWSWIGTVFYASRFDTDDLGYRLLTLLQMLGIAAMAVNIPYGLDKTSAGFALSYAAVRGVLVLKYLRAIRHVPLARPLTTRYALGFGIAAALWFISAFVPPPLRFGFWALGLIIDFATPLTAGKLHAQLPPHASHLPERFGLFTLIVLGESIVAVAEGVAQQELSLLSAIAAVFGLLIAFSFWWVYFDSVDGSAIQSATAAGRVGNYQVWLYAHLPLAIGLTATGVGVEHIILHESTTVLSPVEQYLVCGAVALCLLTLEVIHRTTIAAKRPLRRNFLTLYRLGAATFVLVLGGAGMQFLPIVLISLVALACVLQVFLDIYDDNRLKPE